MDKLSAFELLRLVLCGAEKSTGKNNFDAARNEVH
jgi:hypothetical protein